MGERKFRSLAEVDAAFFPNVCPPKPLPIRKNHIVSYHKGNGMLGRVKWVGKDGTGEPHAVVRWDNGALLLTPSRHLVVQVIKLGAYDRLGYEPRPKTRRASDISHRDIKPENVSTQRKAGEKP